MNILQAVAKALSLTGLTMGAILLIRNGDKALKISIPVMFISATFFFLADGL